MSSSLLLNTLLIVIIIGLIYYFITKMMIDGTYTKSKLDNKEYLVQDLDGKEKASEILSIVKHKIDKLRDHFLRSKNNPEYKKYQKYIDQFCDRIKHVKLYENAPGGEYTSSTENKGEEIALCLRSNKDGDLHDLNVITYVVLHELSHVACPEIDHTQLFKEIFKFFIVVSVNIGIYKIENYAQNPTEYCGMTIRENLIK